MNEHPAGTLPPADPVDAVVRAGSAWPRLAHLERHDRAFVTWTHATATWLPLRRLLAVVSWLGDGWLWLAVALALPFISPVRGLDCLIRMAAVGAVDLVLYLLIKRTVARPRPYAICPGVEAGARSLDEFSFPSGHVLHAVAFTLVLDASWPGAAAVLWPFVALVAASRVVLGLHFVTDVVAGGLLGVVTATACIAWV